MSHLVKYFKLSIEDKKYYKYLKKQEKELKNLKDYPEGYSLAIFGLAYEFIILGFYEYALKLIDQEVEFNTLSGIYSSMKTDENVRMVMLVVLAQMKISEKFKDNYFFKILMGDMEREQLPFSNDVKYSKVPIIVSSYVYFYGNIQISLPNS